MNPVLQDVSIEVFCLPPLCKIIVFACIDFDIKGASTLRQLQADAAAINRTDRIAITGDQLGDREEMRQP